MIYFQNKLQWLCQCLNNHSPDSPVLINFLIHKEQGVFRKKQSVFSVITLLNNSKEKENIYEERLPNQWASLGTNPTDVEDRRWTKEQHVFLVTQDTLLYPTALAGRWKPRQHLWKLTPMTQLSCEQDTRRIQNFIPSLCRFGFFSHFTERQW